MARTTSTIGTSTDRDPRRAPPKSSSRLYKPRAPRTRSPRLKTKPAASESGGQPVTPETTSAMESETPKTTQGDRNGHNSETVEALERTNRAASAANTKLNAVEGRPEQSQQQPLKLQSSLVVVVKTAIQSNQSPCCCSCNRINI